MYDVELNEVYFQNENAFEALSRIEQAINALRKPDGTQKAPAKTCKDLALANPEYENGNGIKIDIGTTDPCVGLVNVSLLI